MKYESKFDIGDGVFCKKSYYEEIYTVEEVIFTKNKILYKISDFSCLFDESELFKLEAGIKIEVEYKKGDNCFKVIGEISCFTKNTVDLILEDRITISNIPFDNIVHFL